MLDRWIGPLRLLIEGNDDNPPFHTRVVELSLQWEISLNDKLEYRRERYGFPPMWIASGNRIVAGQRFDRTVIQLGILRWLNGWVDESSATQLQ